MFTSHGGQSVSPDQTAEQVVASLPSIPLSFSSVPSSPSSLSSSPSPSIHTLASSSTPSPSSSHHTHSHSLSPSISSPSNSSSPSIHSSSSSPPVPNLHLMITRAKHGIFKPKYKPCLVSTVELPFEPPSIVVALQSPQWKNAMQSEYQAPVDNGAWTLVPYTPDMKVISNKWIFKVKTNADGSLDKLKARLVARGFEQFAGVDYLETFSPVIKSSTIRFVFFLAATRHWYIQQLDINNVFLNGLLEDKIFITQPQGFEDATCPDHVCRLKKSFYGLKQALHAWYDTLKSSLISLGFKLCTSDFSLFFRQGSGGLLLILVYVDDILICEDDHSEVLQIIEGLKSEFKLNT